MNPIFPLTTPPTCRLCGHPSVHGIVRPDNPNGNAGRPYFSCKDACHPHTSEFVSWDDDIGIEADNQACWCNLTSRRNITNKEPRRYFYKCAVGECQLFAWGGEAEEDVWGGSGGGGGFPGSGGGAVYVKVEETQAGWSTEGQAMYARPGFDTQMEHDSAYGSQAAGPSGHAAQYAGARMDGFDEWAAGPSGPYIGRQIETPAELAVPVDPRATRQMEETRPSGIESPSFNTQPSRQRQREETPITAGAPVYTPIVGKSADISISSMEEFGGFGGKYTASSRRRCCGICAVM